MPPSQPPATRTATLIFLAMLASVVLTLLVAAALRWAGVFDAVTLPSAVAWAPLVMAGLAAAAVLALRTRLPARGTASAEAWWTAQLPRVVALWALAEGAAMLGTVVYLVTGAPVALAGAGAGLALLAFNTPSMLVER